MKSSDAAEHDGYRKASVQISTNSMSQQSSAATASLMKIQGAYDEQIEKLQLIDKKKARRKVY